MVRCYSGLRKWIEVDAKGSGGRDGLKCKKPGTWTRRRAGAPGPSLAPGGLGKTPTLLSPSSAATQRRLEFSREGESRTLRFQVPRYRRG